MAKKTTSKTASSSTNGVTAQKRQNVFQTFFRNLVLTALVLVAAVALQRYSAERAAEHAEAKEWVDKGYPFEMRAIKGKGMGLFATRDIAQGDRIITERPLFFLGTQVRAPPETVLKEALDKLSSKERKQFLQLADSGMHSDQAVSIFQSNAVAMGSKGGGVCPTFARLNHACLGGFNVVYNYREDEEDIVVQAVRDIKKGEELLTTYTDTLVPRAQRREYLEKHYHFNCTCSACSRSPAELETSDKRLREHAALMKKFSSWATKEIGGKEAIDAAKRIWDIRYNEEKPAYGSTRGQLLADMAQVAAAHHNSEATLHYSEGAAKWFKIELGADSQRFKDAVKILTFGPGMHPQFGKRDKEHIPSPGAGAF